MSRMHKKRRDKRNTYEMQKAMSEMLSAASTTSTDNKTNNDNDNAITNATAEQATSQTVANADVTPTVPNIPEGAQIGSVAPDDENTVENVASDTVTDTEANATDTDSDNATHIASKTNDTDATADNSAIADNHAPIDDVVPSVAPSTDVSNEQQKHVQNDTQSNEQNDEQQPVTQVATDTDMNATDDTHVSDSAMTTPDSDSSREATDTTVDVNASTQDVQPDLNDNLVPNGHETLQEQADRIAKEESRSTLEAIDSQIDASGDKDIEDFISQKIKESLNERDELRRKNDTNGVKRVGRRLNEIAKLRDGDGTDRTLDDVIAGYDKIMKDEDDRLMLIAQREAEREEKERIKRVDELANRLKKMPIEDAQTEIADIDGDDYMVLAERHATLVSNITSYVKPVPVVEQNTDEQSATDSSESDKSDSSNIADTDNQTISHEDNSNTGNATADIVENNVTDSNEIDEKPKSNGLKEYYDRYGGEPESTDIGVIKHKPDQQSEKAKRRQERKKRERERQEMLEKRAAERAEERAKQEGITVEEALEKGDKPLTDEEIAKRNKAHKSGKLTALSIIKSILGIASIGGVEGYAVYEALKSVHNDGVALSGFSSIEHMIAPMLIVVAAWFVLSLILRAVSKTAAADMLATKVDRDANVKSIAYLSADRGVCGKTILIDILRAVAMIVAGGLTLVGIGALAGTDTAMGVSYGFAVLLIVVGVVGKHMYLFGSDDDDDDDATDDDSVTYGLAEIQRRIELINAVFRPLLVASVVSIVVTSITAFMPMRTGTQLFDLGTDAWLAYGAIVALALGRCIAIWMPRGAEDVTSFSSFAWSLLLMFGLAAATALFVIGQYAPAAIAVALIVLICIGLKVLGRGRDSIADLNDYEIE